MRYGMNSPNGFCLWVLPAEEVAAKSHDGSLGERVRSGESRIGQGYGIGRGLAGPFDAPAFLSIATLQEAGGWDTPRILQRAGTSSPSAQPTAIARTGSCLTSPAYLICAPGVAGLVKSGSLLDAHRPGRRSPETLHETRHHGCHALAPTTPGTCRIGD